MADGKMKKKWICKYCDGVNSRKEFYCVGCGARWADVTPDLKETYLEEMPTQLEETKSYPEELNKENDSVVEYPEKEDKKQSVFDSYKAQRSSFSNEIIKELIMKTLVVLTLTLIMFGSIQYIFDIIDSTVKYIESTYTFSSEEYEDSDEI